jgi:hypothetical protein
MGTIAAYVLFFFYQPYPLTTFSQLHGSSFAARTTTDD